MYNPNMDYTFMKELLNMLNKVIDEYKYLKGIVKTNTSCLIDTKKLVTLVVRTKQNRYLRYYDVDFLNFDYDDNTFYVHDINNGYSKPLQNSRIERITIL